MTWPNLFVVGAAKAGTSTLHNILAGHPQITMSSIKEPHFFANNITFENEEQALLAKSEKSYLRLFESDHPAIRYRGESSPSYLWEVDAAYRIKKASPKAKIIVILRDPIARAFSHYRMDYQAEREKNWSFMAALKEDTLRMPKGWNKSRLYVELGLYAESIKRFQSQFDKSQILVLFYEDFFVKSPTQADHLWEFLELDPVEMDSVPILNKSMSGNNLNKFLKNMPMKNWVPMPWRHRTQDLVSGLYKAHPSRKAIQFLLEKYESDLKALHSMGITFYTEYFRQKYSTDPMADFHES